MNAQMLQIRWHGRGGQGAKTAANLFAEAAIKSGQYAQASPEYGAERQGAPVKAYTRISQKPIREHDAVYHPNVVVVLDDSLLNSENPVQGLTSDGALLVNTKRSPSEIRNQLSLKNYQVFTTDATRIALNETGRPIPNTVMMGALLKVDNTLSMDDIERCIRTKLGRKLGKELSESNVKAVQRAFQEVEEEK